MEHIDEIAIETEIETFVLGLLQIHAKHYVLREIEDGKPKTQLFWLPKSTEGIPTSEEAKAEIEREFRKRL